MPDSIPDATSTTAATLCETCGLVLEPGHRCSATAPVTAASGFPESLRVTCSAVPLQIEGPIDGGYLYFRARHGGWQIGIGRDQTAAIEATFDADEPTAFHGEDENEAMSFGDWVKARALIAEYLPRLRLEARSVT